jgi:hypothetical protein
LLVAFSLKTKKASMKGKSLWVPGGRGDEEEVPWICSPTFIFDMV